MLGKNIAQWISGGFFLFSMFDLVLPIQMRGALGVYLEHILVNFLGLGTEYEQFVVV